MGDTVSGVHPADSAHGLVEGRVGRRLGLLRPVREIQRDEFWLDREYDWDAACVAPCSEALPLLLITRDGVRGVGVHLQFAGAIC